MENFEIYSDIELQNEGLFWDLHDVSDFVGLELITAEMLQSCDGVYLQDQIPLIAREISSQG
jgi:hypothetical protein